VSVQRSLQPLRMRYADPALRRLRAFWAWWSAELLELLPQAARDAIAQRRQRLFIETDGDALLLSLGGAMAQRELKRVPRHGGAVDDAQLPRHVMQTILLLPGDKVLVTRLNLPLVAEENLREVLAFEMDRHTPFVANDVYYDYRIVGRDNRKQEVTLDLLYTPRREVDTVLADVLTHGLEPDIATCRRRDRDTLQPVNLLPRDRRRGRRLGVRNLNLALTAMLAVLLVAAVGIPIVQKERAIAAVEAQVEVAAAAAREGSELRRDLEKMAAASQFLTQRKASSVLAVQLIDEISRILPDDTWVARLDISHTEIQLQGQSAASASLIAIVEASPYFENARFRSPVVQIAGTDADRFHLSADLVREQPQ